ncbi:hypothetical protein SprV_1002814500 [Sparganum proliferum]
MQFGIVTGFTSAPNLEMHKAVNLSPIGPTAAHGLHQPSSLLLSLPRLPRREASTYSQIRSLQMSRPKRESPYRATINIFFLLLLLHLHLLLLLLLLNVC